MLNHLLLFLLFGLFVLHAGIYFGVGKGADIMRQIERLIFPVYLWALATHILCNRRFYKRPSP